MFDSCGILYYYILLLLLLILYYYYYYYYTAHLYIYIYIYIYYVSHCLSAQLHTVCSVWSNLRDRIVFVPISDPQLQLNKSALLNTGLPIVKW
ncbi:unnamed protein product [Parnassius mnemosyne]|uniref:ATP synthase F0 subunit 8 n=1 Tax=Parnassius mnemosyne TaxID=213953 RepID=A0AAV1L0L6_9NEOP